MQGKLESTTALFHGSAAGEAKKLNELIRDLRSRIAVHGLGASPNLTPFVTLSWAQSLDGSLAGPQGPAGRRLILSGPDSMRLTHWLRASHQAILVGSGTLIADNPKLTVRLVPGKSPLCVALDSRLCIPDDAALLRTPADLVLLALSNALETAKLAERAAELRNRGVRILTVPADSSGRLNLRTAFILLHSQLGINSLMIEGGAHVIGSVVRAGLAHHAVITVAPLLVGGLRPPFAADKPREAVVAAADTADATDTDAADSTAGSAVTCGAILPQPSESQPSLRDLFSFSLGADVVISGRCNSNPQSTMCACV